MKCSKCGVVMPPNPPNWVKLTEGHFRTYEINDGVWKDYIESAPYWALCPQCYEDIFIGLNRYVDRTIIETKPKKLENITSSTADYWEQEPLVIKANDFINKESAIYINKTEQDFNHLNNLANLDIYEMRVDNLE